MRRIVVTGLIVFSALSLSWVGGESGQRVREVAAATTRVPSPVEVTNFPGVQGVSGTVNVGNLPAVQTVGGSVAINNLPLDTDGAVRVSGNLHLVGSQIHVVGITTAIFPSQPNSPAALTLNRGCNTEFPGTRICSQDEVIRMIPPPLEWSDSVWMVERFESLVVEENVLRGGRAACYTSDGQGIPCQLEVSDPGVHPALCCGF